jgi:predicted dehydrogenase
VEGLLHYRRRSWNPVGDLGDAWLDLGPHLIDLALLAGAGAGAAGLEVVEARLDASSAEVELAAPGCRVVLGCATDRPHRERLRVEGEGGKTILDERAGGLRGLIAVPGRPHPLVASLAAQLEAFALLVRGGEPGGPCPSPATAAEGLAGMELIDAARERSGTGSGAAVR